MTTLDDPDDAWHAYAAQLAEYLISCGDLTDLRWLQAVRETPRHLFVPRHFELDRTAHTWRARRLDGPDDLHPWLARIYAPSTPLITALSTDSEPRLPVPVSSSTAPDRAVRMLEALRPTAKTRVLEVGTGTGYLTALLVHRFGEEKVTSVDIDPDLTTQARRHLGALGHAPSIITGDGADGVPEKAPFDRIVADCAMDQVPSAWIDQTRHGATVLTHLLDLSGIGIPVRLWRRREPAFQGRIVSGPIACTPYRVTVGFALRRPRPLTAVSSIRSSRMSLNPAELDSGPFALLALLHLPSGTRHAVRLNGDNLPASYITAPDGSWAEIAHTPDRRGLHDVREAGATPLADCLEAAWSEWRRLEHRAWTDFGITAASGQTYVWHRKPTGTAWPLPQHDPPR